MKKLILALAVTGSMITFAALVGVVLTFPLGAQESAPPPQDEESLSRQLRDAARSGDWDEYGRLWGEWGEQFGERWADWGEQQGESWGEWGEDFGERWAEWGEDFGERWAEWGERFGEDWAEWGENFGESWAEWGESVGRSFDDADWDSEDWRALERDLEDLGEDMEGSFEDAAEQIQRALQDIDWEAMGRDMEDGMDNVDWEELEELIESTVRSALAAAEASLEQLGDVLSLRRSAKP